MKTLNDEAIAAYKILAEEYIEELIQEHYENAEDLNVDVEVKIPKIKFKITN